MAFLGTGLRAATGSLRLLGRSRRNYSSAHAAASGSAITILDGGMGHQLKRMGVEISGPVGSLRRFLGVAVANIETPALVREAHLTYIDAGADVITTNSYSCIPRCLEQTADGQLGEMVQETGLQGFVQAAGRIARDAADARPGRTVRVAGSLPPLAASYRYDLVAPYEENLADYRKIVEAITPFADVLLCETMSTVDEARAAFTAAAESGLPVWVSWTLDEEQTALRSGESIQAAVAALLECPGAAALDACLFNCSNPEIFSKTMPLLREVVPDTIRIGAYANGFVTAASGQGEYRDIPASEYADKFAAEWQASGATIVGGCCGIFPEHIKALRNSIA